MKQKPSLSAVLTIAAFAALFFAVIIAWAVLAKEITAKTVLSWGFLAIPYCALCLSQLFSMTDHYDHIHQNNLLSFLIGLYLALAVAVTIVLNLLNIPLAPFVVIQLIVLAVGVTTTVAGLLAKLHIEKG